MCVISFLLQIILFYLSAINFTHCTPPIFILQVRGLRSHISGRVTPRSIISAHRPRHSRPRNPSSHFASWSMSLMLAHLQCSLTFSSCAQHSRGGRSPASSSALTSTTLAIRAPCCCCCWRPCFRKERQPWMECCIISSRHEEEEESSPSSFAQASAAVDEAASSSERRKARARVGRESFMIDCTLGLRSVLMGGERSWRGYGLLIVSWGWGYVDSTVAVYGKWYRAWLTRGGPERLLHGVDSLRETLTNWLLMPIGNRIGFGPFDMGVRKKKKSNRQGTPTRPKKNEKPRS